MDVFYPVTHDLDNPLSKHYYHIMNKTILQIPIDKELREQATLMAINSGFSSLQESTRVLLKQFSTGKLKLRFEPEPVQLSAKAIKRYDKMTKDFEEGKNVFTAHSVEELMDHLNNLWTWFTTKTSLLVSKSAFNQIRN